MNTFWLNKPAAGRRIIAHQCPEEEGELEGILQDMTNQSADMA
jgi:hypothetical protein